MRSYQNQPAGTVPRARRLRKDATDTERLLWHALREKLSEWKWRRQVPIGPYFADFFCFDARLIVEVDGGQHDEAAGYDATRTAFIESEGYRVLRFWNHDVLSNIDGVLSVVAASLPSPLMGEGGAQRRMRGSQPA